MTDTTTEIEQQIALDLDTLDTSMNRVFAHYVFPQQGATSDLLIMLPTVIALCGYEFKPTSIAGPGSPTCPGCASTWSGR